MAKPKNMLQNSMHMLVVCHLVSEDYDFSWANMFSCKLSNMLESLGGQGQIQKYAAQ